MTILSSGWTSFVTQLMFLDCNQLQKSIELIYKLTNLSEKQCYVWLYWLKSSTVFRILWQLVWLWTCILTLLTIEKGSINKNMSTAMTTNLKLQKISVQCSVKYRVIVALEQLIECFQKSSTTSRCILTVKYNLFTYTLLNFKRVILLAKDKLKLVIFVRLRTNVSFIILYFWERYAEKNIRSVKKISNSDQRFDGGVIVWILDAVTKIVQKREEKVFNLVVNYN